jgi:hypothetical protein
LFEELDSVVGGSDNIEPALLLSSGTNFGDIDFFNTDTSQSQAPSDIESPTIERETSSHRNGRTHNAKKRPRASIDGLTELLTKRWKEDKEERMERQLIDDEKERIREKKEDERAERAERRQDEMIAVLKQAAEAISRIADSAA